MVLPSLFGGLLFAIGMGGFFIGNQKLSQTISYPICSFAPGLIVSAWSVLYFKEITVRPPGIMEIFFETEKWTRCI